MDILILAGFLIPNEMLTLPTNTVVKKTLLIPSLFFSPSHPLTLSPIPLHPFILNHTLPVQAKSKIISVSVRIGVRLHVAGSVFELLVHGAHAGRHLEWQ